jgi:DNA polymerase III delta subunit
VPRKAHSAAAIPEFDAAPSAVLIVGDVEFFVENAAAEAAKKLADGDVEVLKFDDESPAEVVSDSLLNRSLFSARRLVWFDASRLLGSAAPGELLAEALEAWGKGGPSGKREAFRKVRALLSALDLGPGGEPDDLAATAAKKVRRKDDAPALAEILRELPEERGGPAVLREALRKVVGRPNDGTVALMTAVRPPEKGVELLEEIERHGLLLTIPSSSVPREAQAQLEARLRELAQTRAREWEVAIEPAAIQRLIVRTDADPQAFASELAKLLEWAGQGGRIRAADVVEHVEDEASEDLYAFYDALGRRDSADVLGRLERLFSGRTVRAADRVVDTDNYWPVIFAAMLGTELRRMLLIRSALEAPGAPQFDASMSYNAFQARVLPRLAEPVEPFGRSPFANANGQVSGYLWFKAAQRASRYSTRELSRALARAAEVDVALKSSASPLEAVTSHVARLVAGT